MKLRRALLIVAFTTLPMTLGGCFTKTPPPPPVALTFYGLDDGEVFEKAIASYRSKHPNVSVAYKKFTDPAAFEDMLVNELAEGEGPDLFYLHNTWLPRHIKKLAPFSSEEFTPVMYAENFVHAAAESFVKPDPRDGNKKIFAFPLYVDTLALYYRKSDFEREFPERGRPASTWEVFQEDAARLRRESPEGLLEHGEVALGQAENLSLAPDILYNLFLQGGLNMYDGADLKSVRLTSGQKYFDYFLSFGDSKGKYLSYAAGSPKEQEVDAFLAGKVSAIFEYSDLFARLPSLVQKARASVRSPITMEDIGVAPLPQRTSDESQWKAAANFYGLAVSRNSKNPQTAWDLAYFLTQPGNARVYHEKTHRPAARRDLIEEQKKKPVMEVFVAQTGFAESLPLFSDQAFGQTFREAVGAVRRGEKSSRDALADAEIKLNALLSSVLPKGLMPKIQPKKKK